MVATLERLAAGWPLYSQGALGYWFEPPGRDGAKVHARQTTMGALMRRGMIQSPSQWVGKRKRIWRITAKGRRAIARE